MKKQNGSALIFATVLLFVVLSLVVSLSYVTVVEQKMSQKSKSSVGAFFNADSGVEWALNKIANKSGSDPISSLGTVDGSAIDCPGTFGCKVLFLGQDGKVLATTATIDQVKAVRAVGTQGQEAQRAIEAAVAAGDNSTYTTFGQSSCSTPGDTIYSGMTVFPYGTVGEDPIGGGDTICYSNPRSFTADPRGGWSTGNDQYRSQVINCAVCKGSAYTIYGSTSCPAGTGTIEYSGQAVYSYSGVRDDSSGGGAFCYKGILGSGTSGHGTTWANGVALSAGVINCAVCKL